MHRLPRTLALLVFPAFLVASACAQRASPPPPDTSRGSAESGSGSGSDSGSGTDSGTERGTGAVGTATGTGTSTGTRTGTTTANPRTPPRESAEPTRPAGEEEGDSPWARTSSRRTTPCPEPKPDVVCTKEYRPVTCEGCQYGNTCLAGAAGFASGQCAPVQEEAAGQKCPQPAPDVVCPMVYDPVVCNGCRYSNGCVAGAAGFKKEQCAPAPDE